MLVLLVEEARAGMTLAAPVTHPERPDKVLLKIGYRLQDRILRRLREIGVPQLYVDYPGLDDLDHYLAPNLSPARQRIYAQIKQTIVAGRQRTRPAVGYYDYYTAVRELVLTLMSQGQHPIYIEHIARMGTDSVTHATAVAHLGLLLGLKLQWYLVQQRKRLPLRHAKEVVNIGVGGMLHDMGKLQLPNSLQTYTSVDDPTDPDGQHEWQTHPRRGYEMVRRGIEPSAAAAVLHHHQRWDGNGFPACRHRNGSVSHQRGEQIHIFARVVAAADLYDRLAAPLDTPVRRSNLEVLHLMRTRYDGWCDPVVLKALESIAPPFTPGSKVRLCDGTHAVVVEVDPDAPHQPVVKRIVGHEWRIDDTRVDLRRQKGLTITHVGSTPVQHLLQQPGPETCAVAEA